MKFKKFAAVLAAASMLTVFSAQVASAADKVTVSAEKVTAAAGSEFTLKIDLSGVPAAGVSAVDFALTYDSSIIEITSATAGDIVNLNADGQEAFEGVSVFAADFSNPKVVTVTYGTALEDTAYWITKDGTFLVLKGTVKADAPAGAVSDVKIVANDRSVIDGSDTKNTDINIGNVVGETITPFEVAVSDGSVTVAGGGSDVTEKKLGDVNLDGNVNIMDIILLNKAIYGKAELNDQQLANADVNGDGKPDATDSLNIMKYAIKLISTLEGIS